jgi:hypothetical protein
MKKLCHKGIENNSLFYSRLIAPCDKPMAIYDGKKKLYVGKRLP